MNLEAGTWTVPIRMANDEPIRVLGISNEMQVNIADLTLKRKEVIGSYSERMNLILDGSSKLKPKEVALPLEIDGSSLSLQE